MEKINRGYASLFGTEEAHTDEEVKEGIKKDGFTEVYGWHLTLDNLSNNRRELWSYFLEMGVIEFLNTLSFYRSKQSWESMKIRNANK